MKYQIIETIENNEGTIGYYVVACLKRHIDYYMTIKECLYDPINLATFLVITVYGRGHIDFTYHFLPFQPIDIDKMVIEIKDKLKNFSYPCRSRKET